jgi:hypothetical protein
MELIQKTTLDRNLSKINELISTNVNIFAAAAKSLNNTLRGFWALPDAELEELLNLMGVIKVSEVFTSHNYAALSINKILDDAGYDGERAITGPLKEFTIDSETGYISIVVDTDYPSL